jgi:hypothetical protein
MPVPLKPAGLDLAYSFVRLQMNRCWCCAAGNTNVLLRAIKERLQVAIKFEF